MKCREFAGLVHELARREQIDPAIAAIARAHAEACPRCGCLLAETERLAALVHAASVESRRVASPPHLEADLLRAYRHEHTARLAASATRHFGWRRVFALAGAAAALALFAFVLLHLTPDHRSSPLVRQSPTVAQASNRPSDAAASSPGRTTRAASATNDHLASEFVPVPYAGSLGPGDAAVIVRVQVPRTALAELGYPVDETHGNEMVQADLLVGEDGWPHAVRIVR